MKEFVFFLLCVFYVYSKCAWVVPLKDNEGIRMTNFFQKKEENR